MVERRKIRALSYLDLRDVHTKKQAALLMGKPCLFTAGGHRANAVEGIIVGWVKKKRLPWLCHAANFSGHDGMGLEYTHMPSIDQRVRDRNGNVTSTHYWCKPGEMEERWERVKLLRRGT